MVKYNDKKAKNQVLSALTSTYVTPNTQKRICECGDWMEMMADREVAKLKVHQANFCKNRFCPMCAWRLAQKDALRISTLMDYIEVEYDKVLIFVTLTAPNVPGSDLPGEISHYNKAFKKLVERDEIARINQGYIRKLEVTYNAKRDDYHPHFHCIFAVNKSYFKGREYIRQDRWLDLWRDVMDEPSITQVDVRRVKKDGGAADGRGKAINEVAKYAAKDEDYTKNQTVFDTFYKALKGRQVLTFNGLFAAANKKYKAHELDYYMPIDITEYFYMLLYRWGGVEYAETNRRELTKEERCQLQDKIRCDGY